LGSAVPEYSSRVPGQTQGSIWGQSVYLITQTSERSDAEPSQIQEPVFGIPKTSSAFRLPGLLESSGCEEAREASWLETRQIIDGKADRLLPKPNQFLQNVLI